MKFEKSFALVFLMLSLAMPAHSAPRPKTETASTSVITPLPPSPDSPPVGLAVGASYMTTSVTGTTGAITALIKFNDTSTLQALLGIGSTSPFSFGVAGIYKHTIARSTGASLHLGGGLGLGSVLSTFFLSVNGIAGIAVKFPGAADVEIHVDGGFGLTVASGTANFGIGSGAISLAYLL